MVTKKKISKVRVIKTDYPKPESYTVPYDCTNCGWHGTIRFNRGRSAPATTTCPMCDCATAKKSVAWPARIRTESVQKDPIIPSIWPREIPPWPKYPPEPWPMPDVRPFRRNDEWPPRDPWPGYPVRPWNEIDNLPDRYREVLEPRIYVSNASQRDLYD